MFMAQLYVTGSAAQSEINKVVNPACRDIESKIKSVSQKLGRKVSKFGRIILGIVGKSLATSDIFIGSGP
ncbi:MAG: hypothetical protein SCALA701_28190 [Candidatus Scalindua sp.]|nr:MAG: hypothetical protein DWQ00_10450 [Candidatus Scalindua sp.]NOG82288.1 hypothetical protein [Planctomycetota bacterium]RZV65910.1 MAG: hypothetical protein EX341_17725 [Candidatus Scalindua sp. SCAELEC01]GJQ60018.1 MAG: hypothetical protein SCALA701_28190 [Candidatus Scalindua sp.]